MAIALSQTVPYPASSRQDALRCLADALTALAAKLRTGAAASQDFARLTERAKGIALQAWDIRTSRWSFEENAGRLATDLQAFARESAAASARANAETKNNMAVVDGLVAQAARIARLGQDSKAGPDEIRAELDPLEATLVAMQMQVEIGGSLTADAAALAGQAAKLSAHALALRGGPRQADEALATISRALGVFIDEAKLIAARMTTASMGLSDVVTQMATGARQARGRNVDRATGVRW